MPAYRLTAQPVALDRFDILGEDSESVGGFVCHVGLSHEAKNAVSRGQSVVVRHMKPPFESPGRMSVHSVGTAGINADEENQIELCLNEVESEYDAARRRPNPLRQYVIVPHVKSWCAKDGTTLWRRFSCVGLVIESYREADIDLIDDSENALPAVGTDTLEQAYPFLAREREMGPGLREHLGIPGDGPWPVVLATYVLHALNRSATQIRHAPYQPSEGDATFP